MSGANLSVVVSTTVARPPSEVWEHLADLQAHPKWMSDIVRLDFDGEQRRGPGTRMVVETRVGPFRTDDIMEVVDWDEGESITVVHRGAVTGKGRLSVEPDGTGSRVTWAEKLRFPWWLAGPIGEFVARPILRRVWRRNLARLSKLIVA